ncbi:hypothetical protein D3C73_1535870 [compost metagenome]
MQITGLLLALAIDCTPASPPFALAGTLADVSRIMIIKEITFKFVRIMYSYLLN